MNWIINFGLNDEQYKYYKWLKSGNSAHFVYDRDKTWEANGACHGCSQNICCSCTCGRITREMREKFPNIEGSYS